MERRRHTRVAVSYIAGYCEPGGTTLLPCRVIDVSPGGSRVEILSGRSIASGSTIELHIELPGCDRRIVGTLTCTWTRDGSAVQPDGGYSIGGYFSDLPDADRTLLIETAGRDR